MHLISTGTMPQSPPYTSPSPSIIDPQNHHLNDDVREGIGAAGELCHSPGMKGTLLSALALTLIAFPSQAGDLDIEAWLDEPGTKLVAVEFYADWCKPCLESAPRWEALRKKYAAQGLKLVVVNLSEKDERDGACSRLPWNPDESLCNPEIGERLGVTKLPEAFVWSWQGNLLVDRGQHVEKIERVIRQYLDDNPRIQVSATDARGRVDRALQRKVEAALTLTGKLTVVPDKEMKKRLAEVRKSSHQAGKRDDQRCELGAEVSANSLLSVERFDGSLSLSLADAATGCLRVNTSVSWDGEVTEQIVQKATYRLMEKLKRNSVEMPKGAKRKGRRRATVGVEDFSEQEGEWVPEEEEIANVTFTSNPAGATVSLGDTVICKRTPCTRDVEPGRHRVTMALPRYAPKAVNVTLEDGQTVGWRLSPNFATLNVNSSPSDVAVLLNGKAIGKTPISGLEIDAGKHTVEVGGRCYYAKKKKLTLPAGKTHTMDVALKARPAGLSVRARDNEGNSIKGARVFVDGAHLGLTPKTFRVSVCANEVTVEDERYSETWKLGLELKEQQTAKVVAELGYNQDSYDAMEKELRAQGEAAQADLDRRKRANQPEEEEDADRDGDGVPDSVDDCPNEQGPYQNSGCPRSASDDDAGEDDEDDEEPFLQVRLDGLLGLSRCLYIDGGDCAEDEMGVAGQLGLYYYANPNLGFGVSGSVAQWTDFLETLQIRVAAMVRATLPLGAMDVSALAGLGFTRLTFEADVSGAGIERFGLTLPVGARAGIYVDRGVMLGVDASVFVDVYETGNIILLNGQFGLYAELVF